MLELIDMGGDYWWRQCVSDTNGAGFTKLPRKIVACNLLEKNVEK